MNKFNYKKNYNTTCRREISEMRIQRNPTNKNRMDGPLVIVGSRPKRTAIAS